MKNLQDRIGQQIGGYQLLRLLGHGNFGAVYLAQSAPQQKPVVLKLLQMPLSSSEEFKSFLNEARTIRLQHPHIVPLLDFGTSSEDLPYLVMEYIAGGTLRERYPRGTRLPLAIVCQYISQLASALQYAHDQRVVHRDVKPENILLQTDGMVLLSDFGISRIVEQSLATNLDNAAGTPTYIAPEQSYGKPQPASDQYSLAVVAYESLTGSRPFTGTPMEIIIQHRLDAPPSLRALRQDLPIEVDQVITRALAKQPEERFATIEQFAQALSIASQQTSRASTPLMPATRIPSSTLITPALAPPQQRVAPTQTGIPATPGRGLLVPPQLTPSNAGISSLPQSGKEQVPFPIAPPQLTPSFDTGTSSLPRSGKEQVPFPIAPPQLTPSNAGISSLSQSGKEQVAPLIAPPPPRYEMSSSGSLLKNPMTSPIAVSPIEVNPAVGNGLSQPQVRWWSMPLWRRVVLAGLALLIIAGSLLAYFALIVPSAQHQAALQATVSALSHQATAKARTAMQAGQTATAQTQMATAQVGQTATAQGQIIATAQAQGKPHLLWSFATRGVVWSSPNVVNGVVYVGSNDGTLYAINTITAQQEWTFTAGKTIYSLPAVVNGIVYAGSSNTKLYAIDAMTGQQKWAFTTGLGISASPAVVNGIVYISSGDGKLYALDAITGRQKWVFTAGGPFWRSLTVANGVVYAGSIDHKLYAIDAMTGQQKWAFRTASNITASPTIANGVVYVGSADYKLYAIDAITGLQKWAFVTGGEIWSAPTMVNGVVYVGSHDDKLYAIDAATGLKKWVSITGDRVWSSPTVVNGVVYVGSMDHKLYAIDAATGLKKWYFTTGNAIQYSSPIVVNGVVYIGSNDHKLYAIAI